MTFTRRFPRLGRPGFTGSILGLMILGLASMVSAQSAEPPKDSLVALRVSPWPQTASAVDRNALREHPLFKLVGRLGQKALGFEPLKFLDDTFEGTFLAAVVAPEGKGSVKLAEFFEDVEARDDWDRAVRELRSLKNDLISQYGSGEEKYPESLETYLAEVRYYEPSLPAGVSYKYTVSGDGRNFEIQTVFEDWSRLSRLGRPPVFSSGEDDSHLEPTAAPVPLNLVMGAKIREKQQLTALLNRALGPAKNGFWRSDIEHKVGLLVTIRGNWVVAADQMSNLGLFLRTVEGKAPGWSKNPSYQKVSRNVDAGAPLMLFVDTPKIIAAFDPPQSGPEATFAGLAGPWGYSITPTTESQVHFEMFMGVNAPRGSKLEQYMKESGQITGNQATADNIPWDVSNVFALEYTNFKGLIDSVVALFPEVAENYSTGQDMVAGMFGLDAEAGLDRLLSGPVIVNFEEIDAVISGIDGVMHEMRKAEEVYSSPTPDEGEEAVPDSDSAAPTEEPPAERRNPLAYVPFSFAANVPSYLNRTALVKLLEPYLGDSPSTRTLYGVDVITSTDGTVTYAIDGDWVYLSGGRSDRLLRHMLEAAHGRKETLASIDSWSRFQLTSKGRLLAFGHQKVDAFYSVMKGFMLFMGVEFRPLAQELGKLRDYHSVITLMPEGLTLSGEIVKGDDR